MLYSTKSNKETFTVDQIVKVWISGKWKHARIVGIPKVNEVTVMDKVGKYKTTNISNIRSTCAYETQIFN